VSNSRNVILRAIKDALQQKSDLPDLPSKTDVLIQDALADITPGDNKALINQFKNELEKVSGEFIVCENQDQLINAISQELKNLSDPTPLAIAGDGLSVHIANELRNANKNLDIVRTSSIEFPERKYKIAAVHAALVEVSYAIADIGSLVVIQDRTLSLLPHYLPDNIFVILKSDQLLPNLYALFETISIEESKNMLLITGPSRTADIEKILILGAHGPCRLVVLMLENSFDGE
jgi:L-lactate dehydrogenase complex protein LldG